MGQSANEEQVFKAKGAAALFVDELHDTNNAAVRHARHLRCGRLPTLDDRHKHLM